MPTKKYSPEEIIKLLRLVENEGGYRVRFECLATSQNFNANGRF